MDGPDKPTDRLIVMPPNHSLDIKVSKSTNQPKPKPKESLSHTQTIATGAGGVQPTNHDGEIEVSKGVYLSRLHGHFSMKPL